MLPQRQSGSVQTAARSAVSTAQAVSFEAVKARVITRLEDRLNPGASKRMPSSILRQSLRTHAEQLVEVEGNRLNKPDRERLVEEVLSELLGYGPLDELFSDTNVREVLVAGPHAVLVRRDTAGWLPTSVRFRDEAHLRATLDRLATHADPVGGITASVNAFDLKLPNGFRAVAVIPPEAVGLPASAAFVRVEVAPQTQTPEPVAAPSGRFLTTATSRSEITPPSSTTRPLSGTTLPAPPRSVSSGTSPTPQARPSPLERTPAAERDLLAPYRKPILERLIAKLASHGIYDLQRVEVTELRKVISAHIAEYCLKERVYLSDSDQGRLTLEILTTIQR